jgi:aryl-alcohol dehydrogenase-like predicted oxidoreductase
VDHVNLGKSGLKVSRLCVGCMSFGVPERGPTKFGKTRYQGAEEADRQVVERVGEVAASRGVPRAQVALAWLLHKPAVTSPIVGATKLQHLEDAVAALSVKLSDEEIAALEAPYVPHPVAGFS